MYSSSGCGVRIYGKQVILFTFDSICNIMIVLHLLCNNFDIIAIAHGEHPEPALYAFPIKFELDPISFFIRIPSHADQAYACGTHPQGRGTYCSSANLLMLNFSH